MRTIYSMTFEIRNHYIREKIPDNVLRTINVPNPKGRNIYKNKRNWKK